MHKGISVMILSEASEITSKLEADLQSLNFSTTIGVYPEIDIDNILIQDPDIILLDLTKVDDDTYTAFDILQHKGLLPGNIIAGSLVTINSMRQLPLNLPVDEFIVFPYEIIELGFRLRRMIIDKMDETIDDTITIGNLTISPSRYQVTADGNPVVFSYKEYQLFKFLMTHPNRVFSREKLLENIWGENLVTGIRTVDVHIRRIRAKIDDIDSRYIKTIRGVGYTLCSN